MSRCHAEGAQDRKKNACMDVMILCLGDKGDFAMPLRMLPVLADRLTNVSTNLADSAARDFRSPSKKSKK